MTKTSGMWSVLAGFVGSGLCFACGPGSNWREDDNVAVVATPPISTATTTQRSLFEGKTERANGKVAPLAGGTLLVTRDGRAVAADPDRDQVHVVDLATRAVVSVSVQEGDEPGRVVQGPPGTAYVVARRGGVILAVDTIAGTARRIPVCSAPRGAAYDQATSRLYVACRSGVLAAFDTATDKAVARYQLDPDLRDVVLSGDQLVVSRFKAAEMLVVSRDGQVVRRVQPAARAALTGGSVAPSAAYRALSLPGGGVLVGHVESSNTTLPSGAGAYYGATCGGSVADLSVSVVDPGGNPVSVIPSNTLGGASGPLDLALSTDGARVAILAAGNSWTPPNTARRANLWISTPSQLQGGGFNGCGTTGATNAASATVAGEPIAVAFDVNNRWVVQSREPAQLQLEDSTVITLATDRRFDTGLAMFHMNAGGGVSCSSCHPEAGEDGHTWHFSAGLRRSQTLEGGASKRAPFHWAGDLATFDELVDEVMLRRMSLSADVDTAQRAALRDWIDSVPRTPSADDLDPAAIARGRALFEDPKIACSSCHSGSDYSDHKLHDVGTAGTFITPSLVDVNMRAPLFHDGCAVKLEGRFGPCGGGDQHGVTSSLSKEQQADLVQFMRSL